MNRDRRSQPQNSRAGPVHPHGLKIDGTQFWVVHRRREYGPFDYQWSPDLGGIELTFRGAKFGEYCSPYEIFADLREFRLPQRVVEVASIVSGTLVKAILEGIGDRERESLITQMLKRQGLGRFAIIERGSSPRERG